MSVGPDVFGEDYLYFYEPWLTDEASDRQTDLISRLLGLEPGADVLDLACGHGRIANRLAMRGVRVTGLDADELFLERARAGGAGVEYLHGDMRTLPWSGPAFDAVVLWFTAFGYFDDETNAAVLAGIRRVLRPGGRLLLDVNYLPIVLRHRGRQFFQRRDGDALLDEQEWDPRTSVMHTHRTYLRGGEAHELDFAVRMYMPAELGALLLAARFDDVDFRDERGEPLTDEARRVIAVARAPR